MRIAQRMGLDNDGTSLGLAPFEAEMRRRLWWQLLILDNRVAEISGAPGSVTSCSWSTHLPSNVNDNDLFPGTRNGLVESERLTEMLFFSLQCEIFEFTREFRATLGSPTSTKEKVIDAFEVHLENKYLKHCDPSAPIHSISVLMVRLEVWKLRSGMFSTRIPPKMRHQTPPKEKDVAFSASLSALESHNAMLSTASIQNFVWYAFTNPPFPAYLCLLCELRTRTDGELADRAWNQIAKHAENRRKHSSWDHARKSSRIRLAIAGLTVKAWEARERARLHFQPALPVPGFISGLRQLASKRCQTNSHGGDTGLLGGVFDFFEPGGMPSLDSGMDAPFPSDASLMEWPIYNDFMQGDAISTQDFWQGAGSM